MPGVATWPKSKVLQSIIAGLVALLAATCVLMRIAMTSFNNFYSVLIKAYPYPYPYTVLGVFVIAYTIQSIFTTLRRSHSN